MESKGEVIDAKKAVEIAKGYVAAMYQGDEIADLLLEEIELSGGVWRVTVSFGRLDRFAAVTNPLALMSPYKGVRNYKVVTIDAKTGYVVSMKIRSTKDDA